MSKWTGLTIFVGAKLNHPLFTSSLHKIATIFGDAPKKATNLRCFVTSLVFVDLPIKFVVYLFQSICKNSFIKPYCAENYVTANRKVINVFY